MSVAGSVAEQLAIAVSQENRCSYCLAAHTAAAGAYRVPADDIADARSAHASDPKTAAALRFAQLVVRGAAGLVALMLGEPERAHAELAVATGKKDWDKRRDIADRDAKREAERALATRNRYNRR